MEANITVNVILTLTFSLQHEEGREAKQVAASQRANVC